VALSTALLLSSLPRWIELTRAEGRDNAWIKAAQDHLIPELQAQQSVILASYWDAYLLAFLARGQVPIEAVPWDWVRTYGLLHREQLQKKTLWFVREGYGHTLAAQLLANFGSEALERKKDIALTSTYGGRACELWGLPDNSRVVMLMGKYHPRYFCTPYPPGARRDLRNTTP